MFETLSFLDFEGCKFLTEIPSLSRVPNLGALCLDYCTNLNKIHDSVGFLQRLVLLSAQGCTQLEILVPYINLPSLETLDLRGCLRLESFPEVLGVMENIKDVYLDQTALKQLPFTIGNLIGLRRLFLRGCQWMIMLPSYILPKFEIITSYGCRGFRSSEDEEKVKPKVFTNAMCVYNEYRKCFLNVYTRNICSNDVIEMCSPQLSHGVCNPESFKLERFHYGIVNVDKLRSNESSVCFWFQKKFPRVGLWCFAEPEKHFDNMVLDFKLNVLINGTNKLTSSCKYIFYTCNKMDQILSCELQSKVEGAFSENEWTKVEISCEMEHLMPCDSKIVTAYQDWTTKRILQWTLIYVYPDNEKYAFRLFDNYDSPFSTEQNIQKQQIIHKIPQFRFPPLRGLTLPLNNQEAAISRHLDMCDG